jgi:hypothetical protein
VSPARDGADAEGLRVLNDVRRFQAGGGASGSPDSWRWRVWTGDVEDDVGKFCTRPEERDRASESVSRGLSRSS